MVLMAGAEPFMLPGGKTGVLLLHGFTGTPAEMRLLGEHLHGAGYTVLGVRLCGHGTTVEELAKTGWRQWYACVEDGYHLLRSICEKVHVVGLSLGGLLALRLASCQAVDKVVALSAPIHLYDQRTKRLGLYRLFRSYAPKKRRRYVGIDDRYLVHYDHTPLSSLSSLLDLIGQAETFLPRISAPALLVQSRREHTVRPESAQFIYERLGSAAKEIFWLEKSGHIVTLDNERETVYQAVSRFLEG